MSKKTRFDFKNRRALPVIEGVVIAVENEDVLLEVPSIQLLGFSVSCTFIGVLGSRKGSRGEGAQATRRTSSEEMETSYPSVANTATSTESIPEYP